MIPILPRRAIDRRLAMVPAPGTEGQIPVYRTSEGKYVPENLPGGLYLVTIQILTSDPPSPNDGDIWLRSNI